MTAERYQSISPREATPGAGSRLFSFERVRSGSATRFYPGAGAKLHFANRDVDTLEMPGVPSGYLAAGDAVKAYYKGVCVFQGDVATIAEARGRGDDATQTVTCVGPWSKMSRLVYRQNWFTGGGYSRSSRLILNQHQDGTPQNLDSELYEIASHGAAAGSGQSRRTVVPASNGTGRSMSLSKKAGAGNGESSTASGFAAFIGKTVRPRPGRARRSLRRLRER